MPKKQLAAPPCPQCGSESSKVVASRPSKCLTSIVRNRHCNDCGNQWWTVQPREAAVSRYRLRRSPHPIYHEVIEIIP